MRIRDEDVHRLERLARLRLSDAERATVRADLERVLGHLGELADVDVEGVEPMLRPVHVEDALREDEVRPSLPAETVREGAHGAEEGLLRVPRTGGDG